MTSTFDLGSFSLSNRRRQRQNMLRDIDQKLPDPELEQSFGALDYAADAGLGFFRGVGSFVHGLYGAADIIDNTFLGDSLLESMEDPFLGRSKTFVGGLTQGVTNFMLGFVPVAGWLGRGANIGRAAKGLQLAKGLQGTTTGVRLARAGVAGAITDLTVMDGHEARLSNLVQQYTDLQNPVAEYLAADEDDSEALARFKGMLEGVLLGGLVDSFAEVLRGHRVARKAREQLQDPQAAIDGVVNPDRVLGNIRESDFRLMDLEALRRDQDDAFSPFEKTGLDGTDELARGVVEGQPFFLRKIKPEGEARRMWYETDKSGNITGQPLGGNLARATTSLESTIAEQTAKQRVAGAPTAGPEDFADINRLYKPDVQSDLFNKISKTVDLRLEKELAVNPRTILREELDKHLMSRRDLNLSKMTGNQVAVVRAMEQVVGPLVERYGKRIGNDELLAESQRELADLLGLDNQSAGMMASKDVATAEALTVRNITHRTLLMKFGREMFDLAGRIGLEKARYGAAAPRTKALFVQALERVGIHQRAVRGMTGAQGRALQTGNITFMDEIELANYLQSKRGITGGTEKFAQRIRQTYADGGFANTAATMAQVRATVGGRFWDVTHEWWINSLLSNPRTWIVNGIGNSMVAVMRPLEIATGKLLSGNHHGMREFSMEFHGLTRATWESLKVAKHVLIGSGDVADDLIGRTQETGGRQPSITGERFAQKFGIEESHPAAIAVDWIGKYARHPGQVLKATDAFFRNLGYRMFARRKFIERGLDDGMDFAAAESHAERMIDKLIEDGQLFSFETLLRRGRKRALAEGVNQGDEAAVEAYATQYARKLWDEDESVLLRSIAPEVRDEGALRTFTNAMVRGPDAGILTNMGSMLQELQQYHPLARAFAPFIRTPVNLIKFGLERSVQPLTGVAQLYGRNLFGLETANLRHSHNRWLREMTSDDPAQKADALGRLATATGLTGIFGAMAMKGQITGAGPKDRDQRRLLQSAGWQPYSIKLGNGYVSYARLDPFATVIGLTADLVSAGRWGHVDDQGEIERVSMAIHTALAKSLADKTYLRGLSGLMFAISDPDADMGRMLQRFGAGFIPGGTAGAVSFLAGGGAVDPTMREVRGLGEALMAKIPYYSQDLPPVRNFLGEQVHRPRALGSESLEEFGISVVSDMLMPVAHTTTSDKLLSRELINLNYNFRPPRRKFGALDIRDFKKDDGQDAYDRWMQLQGEVNLGGKDLRRALRDLIRNPLYKSMPLESTLEVDSPRISEITRIVTTFRRRAKQQMLREYPQLQIGLALQRSNQNAARLGQPVR